MRNYKLLSSAMIGASLLISGSAFAEVSTALDKDGLFGTTEIPSENLAALPQWRRVIASFDETQKAARLCDEDIQKCASQQMTLWRAKIQELDQENALTKIRGINKFINKWRNVTDQENYNQVDHWANPLEFLTNGGDSEDFAIMKYISLKELRIVPAKMRIVITNDVLRGTTHVILSVLNKGKRYILDSQNDIVLNEKFVKYYVPFYSLNETTRWAHVVGQKSDLADTTEKKNND